MQKNKSAKGFRGDFSEEFKTTLPYVAPINFVLIFVSSGIVIYSGCPYLSAIFYSSGFIIILTLFVLVSRTDTKRENRFVEIDEQNKKLKIKNKELENEVSDKEIVTCDMNKYKDALIKHKEKTRFWPKKIEELRIENEDLKKIIEKQEKIFMLSGSKLSLDIVNSDLPNLKKIAILGLGAVGKTTLIEHICRIPHLDQRTPTNEKHVYIHNFSSNIDNYAGLLDTTGQYLPAQNDLAIEADLIVVLLDHNSIRDAKEIDVNRIDNQINFINVLLHRLETSNHFPKHIYFYLNKQDLWENLPVNEITLMKSKFKVAIDSFSSKMDSKNFIFEDFSNEKNSMSYLCIRIEKYLIESK